MWLVMAAATLHLSTTMMAYSLRRDPVATPGEPGAYAGSACRRTTFFVNIYVEASGLYVFWRRWSTDRA